MMLALLGAFFLRDLFNSLRIRINNTFEQNVIYDMRRDVYARLQRAQEEEATGYPSRVLATWAKRAKTWAAGGEPDDLEKIGEPSPTAVKRDVFVFMINGAKVRAPAAAMALIERLKAKQSG